MRTDRHLAGSGPRDKALSWRQLGTTAATVTTNFYVVEPVNGDAVLSVLTARGAVNHLAAIDSATKTFYSGKQYFGPYTAIRVSSGTVLIHYSDTNG